MSTKKTIPQLDSDGYFVGTTYAYESPLEKGVFLIPAGAVEGPLPLPVSGHRSRWVDGAWISEPEPEPEPPPEPEPDTRTVPELVEALWYAAWDWGNKQFAHVDRTTVSTWASLGMLSPQGISHMTSMVQWYDIVFTTHYAAARAAIETTASWVEPDWASWPSCPVTFNNFVTERTS